MRSNLLGFIDIDEFIKYLNPEGILALEIGYDEAADIKALFEGFDVSIKKDLANLDRVAVISKIN